MIISYFKNTKPINLIFLSVILVLIILFSLFFIENINFTIIHLLRISVLLFSFLLFKYVSENKLLPAENDFGILFYIILSGVFITSFLSVNKITANLLIILSINQLFALKNKRTIDKEKLFNSGFLLSLASIFYPLSVIFILLIFSSIFVFNKLSLKMFVVPVIGFALPLFFIFILKDLFQIELISSYIPEFQIESPYYFNSVNDLSAIVFVSILVLISVVYILTNLNSKLSNNKDYLILTIFYFILSLLLLFISPNKDGSELIFLLFPLSVFFALYIPSIHKKWIINAITFILLILVVWNNITVFY